ncbi:hypothetical protein [Planctomycetes bacterium Poly30]|uniref:hypothetical protein n=1 Tax=Saltatorellus ferox TaxID=2528018 RepID=UPI00119EA126
MSTFPARRGQILARGLLFLPALALLGFTLWQRAEAPPVPQAHGGPTEPMRTGEVGSVDGWEARVTREGAAPLRLRLESLHPEAGRQAFDAAALARTLRRPAGGASVAADDRAEPWRLTVSVAARPGGASAEGPAVVDDLGAIRLDGLEPLVPGSIREARMASEEGVAGSAHDPLVSLFRFPQAPLREGEACDLIFWGAQPEGSVRAVVPGFGDVELMAKARAANRSSSSIARLDARGGRDLPDAPAAREGER